MKSHQQRLEADALARLRADARMAVIDGDSDDLHPHPDPNWNLMWELWVSGVVSLEVLSAEGHVPLDELKDVARVEAWEHNRSGLAEVAARHALARCDVSMLPFGHLEALVALVDRLRDRVAARRPTAATERKRKLDEARHREQLGLVANMIAKSATTAEIVSALAARGDPVRASERTVKKLRRELRLAELGARLTG